MTHTTPLRFTYGDVVRRKSDGRRLTVEYIAQDAYHFSSGTFALIADQDCYELVERASGFFRVDTSARRAPTERYLEHGYETRNEYDDALRGIVKRFGGRIGEKTGERNGFLQLYFTDMPGAVTERAWLPVYLLQPCPKPDYLDLPAQPDPIEREIDEAFGFD